MRLYKKDSKGKIRLLEVTTKDAILIQESGLVDGKKVKHEKVCKPKNIGKTNATTGAEQAELEKRALMFKKLKEGYFLTRKESEDSNVVLPMLAKSIEKEEHKIVYPCFIQPKLDGMRCLGKSGKMISRKNTPITTMEHIADQLEWLDGDYIDGELYAHGLTFQENMKLIKKYRREESEKVKFHVYDLISEDPFSIRYHNLMRKVQYLDHVELVPTYTIKDRAELDTYYAKFMQEGYEGAIVRWGKDGYKVNGRSSNLLKVKVFKDVALEIIDVVESDRVPGQGIVVIEYNGHESKTGSKLSHTERAEMLTNKADYIGKTAEIRYFEETDKGALRFPVFHGIRLDK